MSTSNIKKQTRKQRKSELQTLVEAMSQEQLQQTLLNLLQGSKKEQPEQPIETSTPQRKVQAPAGIEEAKEDLFKSFSQEVRQELLKSFAQSLQSEQSGRSLKLTPGLKISASKNSSKIGPNDSASNLSGTRLTKSKIVIKKLADRKKKLEEEAWVDEPEEGVLLNESSVHEDKLTELSDQEEEVFLNDTVQTANKAECQTGIQGENRIVSKRSNEKYKSPDPFNGARDETIVQTFIFQLENWFELSEITDDTRKLKNFSNLLKGTALKWFMSVKKTTPFKNYHAAVEALLKEFCPALANDTARGRLEALFCGNKTGSYTWFLNRFRDICLEIADLSPQEKFYTFRRKLPDEYRKSVIEQNATTFEEAVTIANRTDLNIVKLRLTKSQSDDKNKDKNNDKNSLLKNQQSEIKKKTTKPKHKNYEKIQTLTLAEKDRRLKNQHCLNCAEENCRANTCEKDFVPRQ